jgi:hypothetical protein
VIRTIREGSTVKTAVFLLLVAAIASACYAGTVADIVAGVSQDNYTQLLKSRLYTQAGNNKYAVVTGPQHDAMRDSIASQFRSLGLETSLEDFTFTTNPRSPIQGTFSGTNVVARLTGTKYPEKQFILGAHYDSMRNPGADDDSSGVAGILEAARVLSAHKFESTILFIAFDFEELSCSGANQYAWRHQDDQILGMLELDMIAYNDGGRNQGEIWTGNRDVQVENATSRGVAQAAARYASDLTVTYAGGDPASDHGPFDGMGFASALLTEGAPYSPYYHRPTDVATDENGNDALLADSTFYLDYSYATKLLRAAVGWLAESAALVAEPEGATTAGALR